MPFKPSAALELRVNRAVRKGRRSPISRTWLMCGSILKRFSTREGKIFLPVGETISSFLRPVMKAYGVDVSQVAGVQPAVAQDFGGSLGVVEVAGKQARALD